MAKADIGVPKGTRDFGPDVVRKRNYILDTIKNTFELYGFQPLETPAMENIETLTGKYGEEGDKLIFKIRSNKNLYKTYPEKADEIKKLLEAEDEADQTFLPHRSSKALRYDLTIPFARYVAMNHGKLNFPFKRYQIQPVWRGDRPQRGRYREFYQCDADVVGSYSLLNEVELANIYASVFDKLKIPVEIKINSRRILTALAEICGGNDKLIDITIAIDKLDKISLEKVKEELAQRGLTAAQIAIIEKYLAISGNNEEKIKAARDLFGNNETAKKGIEELEYLISFSLATDELSSRVKRGTPLSIDFTLARGLNYYTGIIFEVKGPEKVKMGSIGGGGRYDDLTGLFGVPGIPGVGISFGVDRIYDVMEELKLFPADVHVGTQVLFFNLGEAEANASFVLARQLRAKGVRCEVFHESLKFDKQFKYAEKKNIPFVIIIGEKELKDKTCQLKNIMTGKQETIPQTDIFDLSFKP